MNSVEISSADTSGKLIFSDFDGDYFVVSFTSHDIQATVKVYAYSDAVALARLFKTMADKWKGWDGELTWTALEGEFGIVATANSLGHVKLHLNFRENSGPAPWSADIDLKLEAMQVGQAHRELVRLFS